MGTVPAFEASPNPADQVFVRCRCFSDSEGSKASNKKSLAPTIITGKSLEIQSACYIGNYCSIIGYMELKSPLSVRGGRK